MTPYTYSAKKSGGQQEGGHEVVHHVQVEHYQRHTLSHIAFINKKNHKSSAGLAVTFTLSFREKRILDGLFVFKLFGNVQDYVFLFCNLKR